MGKGQECCKGDHHGSGMWRGNVLRQKLRNTALCSGTGAHTAKPCLFYHKCMFPAATWRICKFIFKILWMLFLNCASISFRFCCAVYEKKKKRGRKIFDGVAIGLYVLVAAVERQTDLSTKCFVITSQPCSPEVLSGDVTQWYNDSSQITSVPAQSQQS